MNSAKLQLWRVRLSYLGPPMAVAPYKQWRDNAQVGVLASSIEEAIAAALDAGVPEGGTDPKVWSVNHIGAVDICANEAGKVK